LSLGLQPQPKRPATEWDTKLVKAFAKLACYARTDQINELLWARVKQRKLARSIELNKDTAIKMWEVYAVIERLEELGWKPVKVVEEYTHA